MSTINLITEVPGPKSRAIVERKERVVADAIDLHVPVVIERGEGASFTDLDGNTFLDFSGGLGCLIVGHSHPKVVEAVKRQVERFSHTDFSVVPYEPWVELSERLVTMVGGDRKVFLANSGAEAFEGGFDGRTLLAMSLPSRLSPYKKNFGPFAPEIYRVPFPYPYRSPDPDNAGRRALDDLERAFVTVVDPTTVAAVIVEPGQGEGGFVVPPPDFLAGLQEICRRQGIVLIADEIQTGFGRTGRFLASEHSGIEPDIVTLAKSLAAGYPLSAVVGRTELMDAPGPSAIGGTYVGNPVACAAANAVLDVIEEEALIERATHLGKAIADRWEEVSAEAPEIGEIRGLGAMIGVEFVKDPETKEPNPELVGKIIQHAFQNGVVSVNCGIYRNVLRHLIPLVITDEELEEGLDVLADAVADAQP